MAASTTIERASIDVAHTDTPLARATIARVSLRLLPFLFVLYLFNFLDRTNVSIAALQMNRDLRFSAAAFGLGAGILFVGYALFEVPSNLLLARVGARWWIARIMCTWGVIAVAMALVRTPMQFYVLRFLLGVAEAGFFPGVVYYLSQWFPSDVRARASARPRDSWSPSRSPVCSAARSADRCSGSTGGSASRGGSGSSSPRGFLRSSSVSRCSCC
jgi:sugar phosphate permease